MAGRFTLVYVDAQVGATALKSLFDECADIGPSVVIIEDVDLFIGSRKGGHGGRALGDFLAALDSRPSAQLLVLATTNDIKTLDAAALRTARFGSIIEVPPPGAAAARAILTRLLQQVPGGATVDVATGVAAMPPQATGADLREVVRRAVQSGDGVVDTPALLAVARNGQRTLADSGALGPEGRACSMRRTRRLTWRWTWLGSPTVPVRRPGLLRPRWPARLAPHGQRSPPSNPAPALRPPRCSPSSRGMSHGDSSSASDAIRDGDRRSWLCSSGSRLRPVPGRVPREDPGKVACGDSSDGSARLVRRGYSRR